MKIKVICDPRVIGKMKRFFGSAFIGLTMALIVGSSVLVAADAETRRGDIDLISSYSDIVLPAGVIQTEVEFYLVNLKDQRAHVKLEVAEIPERWEIVIEDQANNYQVKSVALEPEAIAILSLGIKIPSDAEGGINQCSCVRSRAFLHVDSIAVKSFGHTHQNCNIM